MRRSSVLDSWTAIAQSYCHKLAVLSLWCRSWKCPCGLGCSTHLWRCFSYRKIRQGHILLPLRRVRGSYLIGCIPMSIMKSDIRSRPLPTLVSVAHYDAECCFFLAKICNVMQYADVMSIFHPVWLCFSPKWFFYRADEWVHDWTHILSEI